MYALARTFKSITASNDAVTMMYWSSMFVCVVTPDMVYLLLWNSSRRAVWRKTVATSTAFSLVALGMGTDWTYPLRMARASMYFMTRYSSVWAEVYTLSTMAAMRSEIPCQDRNA